MSTDTKPRAWYVDVAALVEPERVGHRAAFVHPPRGAVQDLLSALASAGQIAYYSGRYDESDFQVIDEWLAGHHFPDGVMYLAPIDREGRFIGRIEVEILGRLGERFSPRGRVHEIEGLVVVEVA